MNKKISLDDFPKIKTGLKVPDNYFDQLEASLALKIKEEKNPVIPIYRQKKWLLGAAAVLILGISISILYSLQHSSNLPPQELEHYLYYQSSILPEDLYHSLDDQDILALEKKLELVIYEPDIEHFLNTQNIENYNLMD